MGSHIKHIDKSLQLLQDHQIFSKHSKFSFGVSKVEYLGRIANHMFENTSIPTEDEHLQ
jgi:hypothetical protein